MARIGISAHFVGSLFKVKIDLEYHFFMIRNAHLLWRYVGYSLL